MITIPLKTTKVYEMPDIEGFAHTKHYLVYSDECEFLQILQTKNHSLIGILPREVKRNEFYLRNTAKPITDERANKIRALACAEWH
jgi:hypothetical protein